MPLFSEALWTKLFGNAQSKGARFENSGELGVDYCPYFCSTAMVYSGEVRIYAD